MIVSAAAERISRSLWEESTDELDMSGSENKLSSRKLLDVTQSYSGGYNIYMIMKHTSELVPVLRTGQDIQIYGCKTAWICIWWCWKAPFCLFIYFYWILPRCACSHGSHICEPIYTCVMLLLFVFLRQNWMQVLGHSMFLNEIIPFISPSPQPKAICQWSRCHVHPGPCSTLLLLLPISTVHAQQPTQA